MSLYVVGRVGEHISIRGLLATLHLIAFTLPLAYCKNQTLVDAQGKNLYYPERAKECRLFTHGSL